MAKALKLIAVDPNGEFGDNAPLMIHIRLAEMYRLSSSVSDVTDVAGLHNMRIAAKRLRYTMEVFAPCFAGGSSRKEFKTLYDSVKSVQEQIGNIHDCDVRGPALLDFLHAHAKKRPEIRVGLTALADRQQAERNRLFSEFAAYWQSLQKKGFLRRFLKLLLVSDEAVDKAEE